MKKLIKNILFISFVVSTISLSLAGCKKQPPVYSYDSENSFIIDIADSSKEVLSSPSKKWHITNKRICVVLGYNFNDDSKAHDILNLLETKYGLAQDGGLIYPLVFPEDFMEGGRSYYNNLNLILEEQIDNLSGVVILGAPENTHIALARTQDFWDGSIPYPIVALFPQDDILGLESTCDIVLDKAQEANFNGEVLEEETNLEILIPEAPEILTQTIDYILTLDEPFPKDKSLSNHVICMFKNHQIHHYNDPETGIQSINHFILN